MLVEKWNSLVTPDDLVMFRHEDWRLIGNPAIAAWTLSRAWEADILCALARRQSCDDLITSLADQFAESNSEARLRVEKALAHYILKWIVYFPDKVPTVPPPQPHLEQVYYAITEGCNLRCPYCYASSEKALPGELTPAESLALVDAIADLGCKEFILTGGEPTLRHDVYDIAVRSRARGMRTNIITNGTTIKTPEIARRIAELFNLVTVSIDGGTAETHEMTRGKGTFKAVTRALKLLNDAGVKPKINHVVTPKNADYLPELAHMLSRFNIKYVRLMHHGPLGRGYSDGNDIDWTTYMKTHQFVWGSPEARHIMPDGPKPPRPGSVVGNCGLGGTEIYINSLGDVYPCKLVTASTFKAGNVRQTPLRGIYFGSENLQALRSISVQTLRGCQTCYIRGSCGGGCRAYHMGYSGDINLSASANFCPTLRHQMVSAIWASYGVTGTPLLDKHQTAYEPILVKTGEHYPVPGRFQQSPAVLAKSDVIRLQSA